MRERQHPGKCLTLLLALCLPGVAEAQSIQPQLRAPWRGAARITQGNHGSTSHNVCRQRKIDASNCVWENTYALDIGLSYAEVLAPADGEVTFVKDDTSGMGGRELAITHVGPDGDTFTTVFLHLSRILVSSGYVMQGQPVAESGASSGGSEVGTSPHLHFHIWSGLRSRDSHTMPIENLYLRRIGTDEAFRRYDAREGDLDNANVSVGEPSFESNCDCGGGTSTYRLDKNMPPEHPTGTFVKTTSSEIIYLLRGPDLASKTVYRLLISDAILRNPYQQPYNGDQCVRNQVITISPDEMSRYPDSGNLSAAHAIAGNGQTNPDGTLITRPTGGEVSIVSNGRRRPFPDEPTFLGLGYRFCNVVIDPTYDKYDEDSTVDGIPAIRNSLPPNSPNNLRILK